MISSLRLSSRQHSRRAERWLRLSNGGILPDQKAWDAPRSPPHRTPICLRRAQAGRGGILLNMTSLRQLRLDPAPTVVHRKQPDRRNYPLDQQAESAAQALPTHLPTNSSGLPTYRLRSPPKQTRQVLASASKRCSMETAPMETLACRPFRKGNRTGSEPRDRPKPVEPRQAIVREGSVLRMEARSGFCWTSDGRVGFPAQSVPAEPICRLGACPSIRKVVNIRRLIDVV